MSDRVEAWLRGRGEELRADCASVSQKLTFGQLPRDAVVERLGGDGWATLERLVVPSRKIAYTYLTEARCEGRIVAALPFRGHAAFTEFMLRVEVTPCWSLDPVPSAVTGGIDELDANPDEAMLRELQEETGFDVPLSQLLWLGTVRGTKSVDTTYYLYGARVDGLEQGTLKDDGSELEKQATVAWTTKPFESPDPLCSVIYARLLHGGWVRP